MSGILQALCYGIMVLHLSVSQPDVGYYHATFKDVPVEMMTQEQRLLYRVMRGYDRASRPVFVASRPVVIRLGITLTQILDVDERNQILTTNVWLDQEWIDERLIWENVTDFKTIGILRIPCDLIWLPDIVLYNSVDNHNKGYMKSLAMVQSNGNVFWPPIVKMRSSCKMDITYFPFDDQICKLKLGSWAYDGFQVDVTNRTFEVDLSNYVDNGEWTLVDTKVVRNVLVYACCPEPFPDVTFYLHLRRRVLYYFFNVIIPCMLLSSLTLTGFCLPPDSGEKVTLGLTVLLAFSVFMLLIADNMPPTSEYIPLIGIYLTIIMAMSALSVLFSVFVLNVHHKGGVTHGPPDWLKRLTTTLSKLFCTNVNFQVSDTCASTQSFKTSHGYRTNCHTNMSDAESLLVAEQKFDHHDRSCDMNGVNRDMRSSNHNDCLHAPVSQIRGVDDEIMRYFDTILASHERTLRERSLGHQWQEVARILDKFFFTLFLTITVVSTFVLLIISPMSKNISLD